MAQEQSNATDKLIYFLIGAGIGAITALLFAPKAGRELRADIADATRRGMDYARDTGQQIGQRVSEYYHTGLDQAAELAARGKEAIGEITERGKGAISRQKAQVTAAIEAGKQGYREAKQMDQAKASAVVEES
jgi:gas vesicle protein